MNITDILRRNAMIMSLQATNKQGAIDEMVQKLFDTGYILDKKAYTRGILMREAQASTGLGDGVAMPHAQNNAVKEATVLFAKSEQGVDYDALDGKPTFLFFMIAVPQGADTTHLQTLAALSRLLIDSTLIEKLKHAKTPDEVHALFQAAQEEKQMQDSTMMEQTDTHKDFIVAVTACPTGIAHTYMAEDALKKAAQALGVGIKVETNGTEGVKNRLTKEDIVRADAVIVAADKKVDMDRFNGKRLVNRSVSDGIRKAQSLIQFALGGSAPIFHGENTTDTHMDDTAKGSILSQIYKDLMNGISHMLPFVIGGGIAIALSFLIDQFMGIPQSNLSQLGTYHQVARCFNQVGNAAFGFMLPVLAGYIASSIADRPGLVAGFAVGSLAIAGNAGFLGALVGGFMAGYVMLLLKKLLKKLPSSLEGIKAILFYPVFGLLIAGMLMLLINIPMKFINVSLNDILNNLDGTNAALLGMLLAGMMAVDLGGPINKAAYVFGTATLATSVASGGSVIMASVMAGGMVPPLAVFAATRLFKNKFTKEQRDAGLTNIVMGLSFVTEGAIPFAAADPLRAIPSFVVGSALTGALVGGFGIKLLAPHGGIFVIFLLSHPLFYLLFIVIGACVSGVIFGLLKKKRPSVELI